MPHTNTTTNNGFYVAKISKLQCLVHVHIKLVFASEGRVYLPISHCIHCDVISFVSEMHILTTINEFNVLKTLANLFQNFNCAKKFTKNLWTVVNNYCKTRNLRTGRYCSLSYDGWYVDYYFTISKFMQIYRFKIKIIISQQLLTSCMVFSRSSLRARCSCSIPRPDQVQVSVSI